MKARGRRPSAFLIIVSRCLEPLMKHEARVFDMASQNETIENYAVTCFRKRNNKKLCSVKYFPFYQRGRSGTM